MGAFLDIVGGLANVGSTIAGTVDSIKTNRENLALQKDNLAYQKDLQQAIFQREDNAVQRRGENHERRNTSSISSGNCNL